MSFQDTGGAPHDLGVRALMAAVRNIEVTPGSVQRIRARSLLRPPPGSGNWPIQAEVALYLSGNTTADRLRPFLEGRDGWNLNGRELMSPVYGPWNLASVLAIPQGSELGPQRDGWLRGTWALLALCAQPRPPRKVIFRQHKDRWERDRIRVGYKSGPFVLGAGNRQQEDPKRQEWTGSWFDMTAYHTMLGWAADVPVSHDDSYVIPRDLPMRVTQALRMGKGDAAHYGLSPEGRTALQRFLAQPTRVDHAEELASWLSWFPLPQNVRYRIYRLEDGTSVTIMNPVTNPNRGGAPVTILTPHTAEILIPSAFSKLRARRGHGEAGVTDGFLVDVKATSGGHVLRPETLPRERIAWSIDWNDRGVTFRQGAQELSTTFSDPIDPVPPDHHPVMSSEPELIGPLMEDISDLASTMGLGEKAVRTAGEMLRRMGEGDGDVAEAGLHTWREVDRVWGDR